MLTGEVLMKSNLFTQTAFKSVLFFVCAVICSTNVLARGSVGVGFGFGDSEYKDYDPDTLAFPLVNYEDDTFYFHGLAGGMFLLKNDSGAVTLGASYFPKDYDASDSTNASLQQLNDRHSTGMIDLGYRYRLPKIGTFSALASVDFLDETDGGWKMELGYTKRLRLADKVTVIPGVGAIWFNDSLNQHYYGISAAESTRSTLNQYDPQGSFSPYAELSANVSLLKDVSLFVRGRYVLLDSEVSNSPMVEADHFSAVIVGINLSFK
jgi:outer membrane protein